MAVSFTLTTRVSIDTWDPPSRPLLQITHHQMEFNGFNRNGNIAITVTRDDRSLTFVNIFNNNPLIKFVSVIVLY